jgi:hypothetical protein
MIALRFNTSHGFSSGFASSKALDQRLLRSTFKVLVGNVGHHDNIHNELPEVRELF